ncbi:LPXTG cell wall anchor domain-containing protein [Brevibacterium casei]
MTSRCAPPHTDRRHSNEEAHPRTGCRPCVHRTRRRPVAAAEAPTTQSAEAKAAEKEKAEKEKAEKEAAAKEAAEKKEAEEKAAAKKKADEEAAAKKKADEEAARTKAAAKKESDSDATKPPERVEPSPAKSSAAPNPSDKPTNEAQKADPVLVVPQGEVAAEDLADPAKGVTVTVNGLEAGDELTPLNGLAGDSVTATGTSATMKLYFDGNAEDLNDGPKAFTIDYQGAAGIKELSGSVNVKAAEDTSIKATLSVEPAEMTAEDITNKDKGLIVTVKGVKAGDTITNTLTDDIVTVEEDGDQVLYLYYRGKPSDLAPGVLAFDVTVNRDGEKPKELPGEVTIVEDDAVAPIEASLKVVPKEVTAADLANEKKGVKVTVSGVKAGDVITDSLTGIEKTATEDGDFTFTLYYDGNPENIEEGPVDFTVTIDREGTDSATLKGQFTVVNDEPEAPAEATLTVSPKSIESGDFINEKKGVKLSVKDCQPGEGVRFMVKAKDRSNITAYDRTIKANKDGKATVTVFGTSDNASAYVGSYSVTVTCGDTTMKDSFKVTGSPNAGGGDGSGDEGHDNGSAGSGSELPRTGAELNGLAAGALLLLVGGAAVTITMRRRKGDFSPSYI